MKTMVDYLHATDPAVGVDRVLVPGEPEIASTQTRGAGGIPIDDNTWNSLLKSAQVAGMSETEVAALTG